jgi:hypothetical protein
MTNAWIKTPDGDLLRADQIRQINVVEGLRIVTIGGSQFVIAEIEGRQAATAAAHSLAAAIAEADKWSQAAEIGVVHAGADWKVRLTPMADTARSEDEAAL